MFLKTFANSFKYQNLNENVMEYYDGDVTSLPSANAGRTIWLTNAVSSYDDRSNNGWYLRIGSSNAESSYESGSLVSPITTLTEVSRSIVSNSGDIMKSITTVFQNNTNESVTVKEVGIGINLALSAGVHAMTSILARRVLTTPITINPGEVYSFMYQISLSMEG